MNRPNDPIHAVCVGLAITALTLAGCAESTSPADENNQDHAHDHDHNQDHAHDTPADAARTPDVYENIRGIITYLPTAGSPDPHMKIRHEHIPEFRNEEGEIFVSPDGIPGMRSMQMGFPTAPHVALDGLSVDDKVEFTFRVNWGGSPPWEITEITKLDPATQIDFTNSMIDNDPDDNPDDNPDASTDTDDGP